MKREYIDRNTVWLLAATTIYLLLSLITLGPVLPYFATAIMGGPIANMDGWQNVWHLWWAAQAITTGQNPFVTPLLYHPDQALLYVQPLNLSNGILVLPITLAFGPVAGYNSVVLLAFVLAGVAGYLLALRVTGHHLAALVGGLAFAWSPFHLTRLYDGQLELIALQWPAFYAFFALRAVEDRRVRDALLAGLMLALTGYTSWYYLLFMLVWSSIFALLWWQRPWVVAVRQWAMIGALALLLLAPALLPGLWSLYRDDRSLDAVNPEDLRAYSANLVDFALPSYLHPLWGPLVHRTAGAGWHQLSGDWNVALGYTILLLAALGLGMARRLAWRWAILAGVGMLFALGPELLVATWRTGIPLPYQLIQALPGAAFGLRPMRFTMLTTLALAPLVALGVRELLARAGQRQHSVAVVIIALCLFELLPMQRQNHSAAIHPYYHTLGPEDGVLLHVPVPLYKNVQPQKAQMTHGATLIGGYLARTPAYDLLVAPGIRSFLHLQPEREQMLDPAGTAVAIFNYYQIRQVIVNWDAMHPERRPLVAEAISQVLPGVAPIYSDETLTAFPVPVVAPRPFAFFGDGWHPEEYQDGRRWRWMSEQAELRLFNPDAEPQRFALHLALKSYQEPRELTLMLDEMWLDQWPIPVSAEPQARTLHLLLPPGEQRLSLSAPAEPEAQAPGRMLSVVLLEVR
ncbi:hypothetical protein [Candidatus Viridilinea mediisalina]|uniref:Glycosyltransferase RgtA/B/C/D-like domain-containing protein n=1 Tax=Candidatus Viridilinea mediisalina TaxID=2024553 RepID=A0A2A6RJ28_9CHLR|nr:hypothetical protein [Candidatus Viridilinea mediisalina]PDW03077.1 hypothetical protein CJ255_10530 [Candidatus Viridilinea mediisalina]